jgi:F-type H+-transporting ATPase subunit gamma
MAGGQERALRRRIRSIEATKKITRAMELIAASQIPRARARIAGSLPYVDGIEAILAVTAAEASGATRLIGIPEKIDNALVICIVGDRGQAGAYNTNVLRATERLVAAGTAQGTTYGIVSVGRKAISYFRFREKPVTRSFVAMTDRPKFEDARQVAQEVTGPFLSGEVDSVQLVSTRYRSAGVQEVEIRQLLPLPEPPAPAGDDASVLQGDQASGGQGFYDFEPAPEDLLTLLVPRYAEAVLYRALLEASVSEHTARQRAMAAATENAEDLMVQYRREMNRARQESITTEIMEIVSGAEALRGAGGAVIDIDEIFNEMNQEQSA